jgi:hypothetical protein
MTNIRYSILFQEKILLLWKGSKSPRLDNFHSSTRGISYPMGVGATLTLFDQNTKDSWHNLRPTGTANLYFGYSELSFCLSDWEQGFVSNCRSLMDPEVVNQI